jgi:predicted transposase YdaD
MGHPQAATPIQTDNACAAGIAHETVKQRRSKAIDMCFYWIRDRIKQCQFIIHWRAGKYNLVDYFIKHHSPAHHKLMRSRYLLELHKPAPT